jgi:hypothetical protein
MNQLQGPGHDKGVRQLVAPLDASTKRSLTLNPDGPDTPLHSPPIGLKSFDDGHWQSNPNSKNCADLDRPIPT